MGLLAEVIIEEWLNLNGYFTIRGIKLGQNEIDFLAIKPLESGGIDRRHIECQISSNPISYISGSSNAKRRSLEQLRTDVETWIEKKFRQKKFKELRQSLCPGEWKYELVLGKSRFPEEREELSKHIEIIPFVSILKDLEKRNRMFKSAAGGDVWELMTWIKKIDQ